MKPQRLVKIFAPILLIFVLFGDLFLPSPLSEVSHSIKYGIKNSVNQFLEAIFPRYKAIDPQKRTRDEIDKLKQK